MPGRTSMDEDMYSQACRNSSFGESCSIARANKNSSRSFQRPTDRPPAQVPGDLAQMVGAGLLTGTVTLFLRWMVPRAPQRHEILGRL
jgi:hypothetical protein